MFGVWFAASTVFGALGWWTVAGTASTLGIAGVTAVDVLWPDGARTTLGRDGGTTTDDAGESVTDAFDTLRNRCARGDLDDEFEPKPEAVLETEVPEDARRRIGRGRGEELSTTT